MRTVKWIFLAFFGLVSPMAMARLVFWAPLSENLTDKVSGEQGQLLGGAKFDLKSLGLDVAGRDGVLRFADKDRYAMGQSFTLSAAVWVRELPKGGTSPAGQIFFRGDDRSGLDNYSLCLGEDGYFTFCFNSADNNGTGVRAKATKERWQFLVANFDARARELRLYVNGVIVGQSATPLFPTINMDSNASPALSIGNVQNPLGGCHNQPFNGFIRDVRLYDETVLPDQISWRDVPTGRK